MRFSGVSWLMAAVLPLALAACGDDAREKELTAQLAQAKEEAQAAKASAAEAREAAAAQAATNDAGLADFYGSDGDGDEGFAPDPDSMPEEDFSSDGSGEGPDMDMPAAQDVLIDDGGEVYPEV